MGQKESGMR